MSARRNAQNPFGSPNAFFPLTRDREGSLDRHFPPEIQALLRPYGGRTCFPEFLEELSIISGYLNRQHSKGPGGYDGRGPLYDLAHQGVLTQGGPNFNQVTYDAVMDELRRLPELVSQMRQTQGFFIPGRR